MFERGKVIYDSQRTRDERIQKVLHQYFVRGGIDKQEVLQQQIGELQSFRPFDHSAQPEPVKWKITTTGIEYSKKEPTATEYRHMTRPVLKALSNGAVFDWDLVEIFERPITRVRHALKIMANLDTKCPYKILDGEQSECPSYRTPLVESIIENVLNSEKAI